MPKWLPLLELKLRPVFNNPPLAPLVFNSPPFRLVKLNLPAARQFPCLEIKLMEFSELPLSLSLLAF